MIKIFILSIFPILLLNSCGDVVKPLPEEPVDSIVVYTAREVSRALLHSGGAFTRFEVIDVGEIPYEAVYSRNLLEKISFDSVKLCWLDSINKTQPWYQCSNMRSAYDGLLIVNYIKPSASYEGEFVELFFYKDTTSPLVTLDSPLLFRKIDKIDYAYVSYAGAYEMISPAKYDLDHFRCYRFSSTLYPWYSGYDSLRFLEVSDSSAPLAEGGSRQPLQGQTSTFWKAESVKVEMGLSAGYPADVPAKTIRWGRYVWNITGYKADRLIDSVVFSSGKVAFARAADSVKVSIGDDSATFAKIKIQTGNGYTCKWGSGRELVCNGGTGFRSSVHRFSDSTSFTAFVQSDTLISEKRKGNDISDSMKFTIVNDSLLWRAEVDSSKNLNGSIYWAGRQVCTKFSVQSAGLNGYALFNPWTGNGKCYVSNGNGILYPFVFSYTIPTRIAR